MRGALVQVAPVGAAGRSIFQLVSLGTSMVKPIHLPSGDQRGPPGVFSTRVTWLTAPSASMYFTKICDPDGSPSARKAIRVPSGDHTGFDPLARKRSLPPSELMIQSAVSNWSFILSTKRRVKITCDPSGEGRGSLTVSKSRWRPTGSSVSDGFSCAAAELETTARRTNPAHECFIESLISIRRWFSLFALH